MRIKFIIFLSILIYLSAFVFGAIAYQPINNYNHSLIEKPDFSYIIKNNILIIIIQLFVFGIGSFANLTLNGLQMGLSLSSMVKDGYITEILYLVVPHAILEIPAIIIAGAAGFKIPYEITRYLTGKKEQILTRQDIKEYVALALISIVLIVIAAWIEANVTMRIAESMLNSSGG